MKRQTFTAWRLAADHALLARYGIDYAEGGADDERMRAFYAEGVDPIELAGWWGEKYGLSEPDHYDDHEAIIRRADERVDARAAEITADLDIDWKATPDLDTCLCVWEDIYDRIHPDRAGQNPQLEHLRSEVCGTPGLRAEVPRIALYVDAVWAKLPDQDHIQFDWEFVPAVIDQLIWARSWRGDEFCDFPPIEEMIECLTCRLTAS